jgi:hypothetical protein
METALIIVHNDYAAVDARLHTTAAAVRSGHVSVVESDGEP